MRKPWDDKKSIEEKFGFNCEMGFIKPRTKTTQNPFWADMAYSVKTKLQNNDPNFRKTLEEQISKAPDFILPENIEEATFALSDLCFIQNALLQSGKRDPSDNKIPEKLAIPLLALSEKVGLPPLMSYPLYILYNAKKLDKKDLTEIEYTAYNTFTQHYKTETLTDNNLAKNPDHNDEAHFVRIHLAIEKISVNLFNSMFEILAIDPQDFESKKEHIKKSLTAMTSSLKSMKDALNMMFIGTGVDAFNDMRLFLKGTQEFKGGVYSNQTNTPLSNHPGGSGAQSPLFMLIDNFLGIELKEGAKSFREAQQCFVLPQARELAKAIKESSKEAVKFISENEEMKPLLEQLTTELVKYRNAHIKMASIYIGKQQGTGGSDPSSTLGSIRDSTKALKETFRSASKL